MPETLQIGEFVLGAVLLLVGLFGGNFKIFGAEISGTAGKFGRTIAIVLALALWGWAGLGQDNNPRPPNPPTANPPPYLPPPSPAKSNPSTNVDITGTWLDPNGIIVSIWPMGSNTFGFNSRNPATNLLVSQGTVSVEGRQFRSTYSGGSATGIISDDGSQLNGTYQDYAGFHPLTLYRQ